MTKTNQKILSQLHSISVLILSFVFISCGSDKNNNNNNFNNNIEINVTGLSNDTKALRNKEWRWGCEEYNKTDKKKKASDCTYRHAINQKTTHKFASNVKYDDTRKATRKGESKDDRTKYYIHVQAKAKSNIVSKIKSVYTLLDTTPPQALKSSNVKAPTGRSTGKTFRVTVNGLKTGDTVTIYAPPPPPPSNFLGLRFLASLFARRNTEGSNCVSGNAVGKATVSSGTSVVVTVTAREGTSNYHAQVVDEAGNRGPCSQVFEHTNTGGILEVTGLTTDKNPRRFKSWEWGCTTEKTLPCEYRHTINNKATHLFDSKATYSANNRANTTGKSNNLWYLHVQAKNTKRESNVKSVSVRIDRTSPETPNAGSVTYKVLNSRLHSLEVTFRDLILRDRVYLYNTSNCQGSSLGTARVTNNNQAVITFKATGNRQKYYAQVVDEADNRSGCGEVFTYPDNVLPVLPAVTGLANDKTPRKIKSWEWGCTTESMDPPHTCEYRHTINDKATHTFADSVEYSLDNEASTRGKADDKWSLHVQAKNRAGASSVKSVSVTIDNTAPKTPDNNSMTFRSTDNHQVTVTFSDTGILSGEHIYIYDASNCRGRTLGDSVVDNNNRAVITFNAGSTPKRYYANIIDQAGNKGGCGYYIFLSFRACCCARSHRSNT